MARGEKIEHPSFGKIRVSRVSGSQPLVGVDFQTGHYMVLEISEMSMERNLSDNWFFGGKPVVSIRMSEVQWAQFLSSPNTEGVPCTLEHRHTEGFKRMPNPEVLPPMDVTQVQDEIAETAKKAMEGVTAARAKLAEILKGGAAKKGDLADLARLLEQAEMNAVNNLPYVVERGQETLSDQQAKAKGEVESYLNFAIGKLGERAFAAAAQSAIDKGEDPTKYLLESRSED